MMDTRRLILFFVFSFSLFLLWEAWQKEQHVQQQAVAAAEKGRDASAIPSHSIAVAPTPPASGKLQDPPKPAPTVPAVREVVRVETDAIRADIDTMGGDIVFLELLQHRDTVDQTKNLVLFGPLHRYTAQSGFTGGDLPNHQTVYSAKAKEFKLEAGKDAISVRLEAEGKGAAAGAKVAKILTFRRGSYLIDVEQQIVNSSGAPIETTAYFQLTRDGKPPAGDSKMLSTYTGAAIYTEQEKFHKIDFSEIDKNDKNRTPLKKNADNGWVAFLQHYFVAAVLPPEKQPREFYAEKLADDFFRVGVKLAVPVVAPGTTGVTKVSLYAGPEEQEKLTTIAPGLERTVDYGWLTVIAAPLFWVLQYFHSWLGNWGLAIILLTVVIKLIFFPLSAASYKSMAKMKLVTPRMMKIREQYANDRMKQNQAMMDLYKTEKINPLGGCLPIVVQIPVFIALYWVLLASVELRHASWLWVPDLAAPDAMFRIPGIDMPVGVLPIVMMVTMIFQTRMNPTPPDPVQAKVMQIMPFAFGVMFFFFPAGLVLYWVVNNVLSIAQQWQITRMIESGKSTTSSAKR